MLDPTSSSYTLRQEICQTFSKKIFSEIVAQICIKMLKKMITVVQNNCSLFGQLDFYAIQVVVCKWAWVAMSFCFENLCYV